MHMDERRLKDVVKHGTSEDVVNAVLRIETALINITDWIRINLPRDERNLIFFNFLTAAIPHIRIAAQHHSGPTQVLALSARSLYELCLRARQIRTSHDALLQWRDEFAFDHIELLEGWLELSPDAAPSARSVLEKELARKRQIAAKHGAKRQRRPQLADIAKNIGDDAEYRSLVKLYSKLLHPSSFLVNSTTDQTQGPMICNMLIIQIQKYALSLFEEIRVELNVPKIVLQNPS
jgi:hypothetical protein